ncbi:MAG: universal stress protein [Halodesulfurarchaeum sp.]
MRPRWVATQPDIFEMGENWLATGGVGMDDGKDVLATVKDGTNDGDGADVDMTARPGRPCQGRLSSWPSFPRNAPVSRPSQATEHPTPGEYDLFREPEYRRTMGDATDGDVLVAVENPEHVQQLLRTASDLAILLGGGVRIVTVAVKPLGSPFGLFDDETIRQEFAEESRELQERAAPPADVEVSQDIVVARSVSRGLQRAVTRTDPAGLVVGWEGGPERADAVLGSTLDSLLERARCDLYIERIGREADGVSSVLLPVAGGPHVPTAATVATAIAVRNDATVHLVTVRTAGTPREQAEEGIDEGRTALEGVPGPVPDVESTVIDATDTSTATDALVEEAAGHDVVVLGATRKGPLRRRLVGSVPQDVVGRTDRTLIVARSETAVGGFLARLGEVIRR